MTLLGKIVVFAVGDMYDTVQLPLATGLLVTQATDSTVLHTGSRLMCTLRCRVHACRSGQR